jgi:outer membrane protein TolC
LRAKQQHRAAKSSYDLAIASLGLLLGREEAFDVVAPPSTTDAPPGEADALIEKALASRPDVSAERRAVEIAKRGELDAWMMFMPSINLIASARATSFTQGFVRDPITGTLSINASLPLYDGGLRYAAMKDSSSRIREENIRLRQLEDRVRAQVRGNLRDLAVKQEALSLSQEAVAVARVAHEQAQAMFDAGVGTSLDVSDTALALFVSESDLARAELDLQLTKAGLQYVTGYAGGDLR